MPSELVPWFGGCWWIGLLMAIVMLTAVLLMFGRRGGGFPCSPGSARESTRPAERPTDAVELLRARYARGEIDRDEFLRVRDDLGK